MSKLNFDNDTNGTFTYTLNGKEETIHFELVDGNVVCTTEDGSVEETALVRHLGGAVITGQGFKDVVLNKCNSFISKHGLGNSLRRNCVPGYARRFD